MFSVFYSINVQNKTWYEYHNSKCMYQGSVLYIVAAVSVDEWKQDVYMCLSRILENGCIELSTFPTTIIYAL